MKPETLNMAIRKQVQDVLRRPDVPVDNANVREVATLVTNEIAPQVAFATNNEPFYQSYVTLGSAGALVTSIGRIMTNLGGVNPDLIGATPDIVVVVSALVALWGRWRAKKPIGA